MATIYPQQGKQSKVKTAKGTEVLTEFCVVEAATLITSHDACTGTKNPDFPAELQPRDRERGTSRAWVMKTAGNLDPEQLGSTRRADTGAPIVGADGIVESGNGRAMAIALAYAHGTAHEYREWLEAEAGFFGFSPAIVQMMAQPVLVRLRTSEVDRAAFVVEANQDDKLAMTATEKARADARRLSEDMICLMTDNGDLTAASNRAFLSAFLQSLGDAEAAQYTTTDGKPTCTLIARVQAAIFARAYNDDRLLELTADVAKPEVANLLHALNFAAPEFIQADALDVARNDDPSLNAQAIGAIIGATNLLKQAREMGVCVEEVIKQQGLFSDMDPAMAVMAVFISKNNRSGKRLGTAFKAMASFVKSEVARRQTADIFGDVQRVDFEDIVNAANAEMDRVYGEGAYAIEMGDLFAPAPAAPAAPVESVLAEVAPAAQEPAPVPAVTDEGPQDLAPTEAPTAAPTEAPTAAPELAEVVAEVAPAAQKPALVPSAADEVPQDLAPVVAGFVADIPAGLAVQAYTGTSFSPERRGASIRKEYADDLAQVLDVLQEHARKGGTLDKLADVFQAYRMRQGRALRAYLASSSHCFSAMIAGPARFPVARMQKREGIAHKRLNEYLDGGKVALQRAIRELRPDLRPIMAGDADALDRLTSKLAQAERDHAMMKAGNVAIRKHAKAGQAHQVAALLELGFTERAAIEATKPDHMGRAGFARFELTNSNANIKRIKERIEQIERNQAAQVVQTEGADGVTLEDDAPANRVRLYFPGKPSDDVRADLKAHGFRWAPSVGAWQAYRNWRALTAAQRLAGVNLAEAQAPTTAPELAEVAAEVAPAAQELAPVLVVADEVPQDLAPTEAPTAAPTEAPTAAPVVAEVVAEVAPAAQEPAPVPAVTDEGPQDLAPVVPVLHQKARAKSGAWTAQLWQAGGLCWLAFLVLGAAAPVFSSYATRREMLTALQRLGAGLLAQGGALGLVEHTTARGKVLRGVVRADLTKAQAQALDAYTFRKDGGWFIRERHLTEAAPVVAQAVQVAPEAQEVAPVPTVADKVAQVLADAQQATAADERAALLAQFAHLEQGGGPAVASRNIKRQLKRTWPGVVFSVRKSSTGAVNVQWADGPTEGQVNALLRRFELGSFDCMTECYEYHADIFSDLFGGCHYLFTRRNVGAELVQRAIDAAFSYWGVVPSAEDYQASRGVFDWRSSEGRVWARRVRDALAELDATAERADVAELA